MHSGVGKAKGNDPFVNETKTCFDASVATVELGLIPKIELSATIANVAECIFLVENEVLVNIFDLLFSVIYCK